MNHRECIRIDERNTKMMLMVINAAQTYNFAESTQTRILMKQNANTA
jgi:hypothetical protein